jgi:hypothetical protein
MLLISFVFVLCLLPSHSDKSYQSELNRSICNYPHPSLAHIHFQSYHTPSHTHTIMSLAGKVAIVTGGSKGIGRATCIKLAREGAKVVVNYSSGSEAAGEVVSTIGSENATAIKADAGNVEEIEKLVNGTVEKYGKIDIVVACAAIMSLNELEKVTEAEYDRLMSLNVKGPVFLAQVWLFFW